MRGIFAAFACAVVGGTFVACGGSAPPAQTAASAPEPATSVRAKDTVQTTGTVASAVTAPPAATAAQASADPPLDDPNERSGPISMAPQFGKEKAKKSFPKKAVGDEQCWSTVSPTGEHAKDYAALVAACGTPTGLAEYAKPVSGKLHHLHDPSDVFTMPVLAGYCYRYFAVGDSSITDLDLLIEKQGGALVGDDKTSSPIAIIETGDTWCQDEDQTLEFHVKVDGPGKGGYTFGVWARPKH